MKAYSDSMKIGQQVMAYAEGPAVEAVMGLRLNQALIGEDVVGACAERRGERDQGVFTRSGRKTGLLPPLPE